MLSAGRPHSVARHLVIADGRILGRADAVWLALI
jgi:hypothetical protein